MAEQVNHHRHRRGKRPPLRRSPDAPTAALPSDPSLPDDILPDALPHDEHARVTTALAVAAEADKAEHSIQDCATHLLDYIGGQDSTWELRIQALMDERQFDPVRTVTALITWMLEQGLHMSVPSHSFFDFGPEELVSRHTPRPCPVCQEAYVPDYPGQPACLNEVCGTEYNRRRRAGELATHG